MRGSIHAGKVPGMQRDTHVSPRLAVSRVCCLRHSISIRSVCVCARARARACRVRLKYVDQISLKYVEQISVMVCMTSVLPCSPAPFPTLTPSLSRLLSLAPYRPSSTNKGAGGEGTRRHSALMAQIVCNGCSLQLMYPRSADSGACVREN